MHVYLSSYFEYGLINVIKFLIIVHECMWIWMFIKLIKKYKYKKRLLNEDWKLLKNKNQRLKGDFLIKIES